MRITESRLRALIRTVLLREADEDEEKLPGWKPPWEGGGSGSGGHAGDRHWADNEYDHDEFGMAEADDADEGGGDEEE